MDLKHAKTFVFIDVSNIRRACNKGLGFNISFMRFKNYLKHKYHRLEDVRYYEGMSIGDEKKKEYLDYLKKVGGFTICTLERKSYYTGPSEVSCVCDYCGRETKLQIAAGYTKFKSNVDVYIAANMVEIAATNDGPLHFILVSCDGDYDEAVRSVFRINSNVFFTIIATSLSAKPENSMSLRLKNLQSEFQEHLAIVDINVLKDRIQYTERRH